MTKIIKTTQSSHKKYKNSKYTSYKCESENEDFNQYNNKYYVDSDYSDEQEYFTGDENHMETFHKSVKKSKKKNKKKIENKKKM